MVNSTNKSTPSSPLSPTRLTSPNRKSKSITRCVSMCNTDPHSDDSIHDGTIGGNSLKATPKQNGRKRPRTTTGGGIVSMKGILSPTNKSKKQVLHPDSQSSKMMRNQDDNEGLDMVNSAMDIDADTAMSDTTITKNKKSIDVPTKALGPASTAAIHLSPYTRIPASPVRSVVSCDGDSDHIPLCKISETAKRVSILSHGCSDMKKKALEQNLHLHCKGLWTEANLAPMKPLLYRLITHQSYNRKGTFNYPVDAEALGLKDYNLIIKRPMDLGTIKSKLLSNLYADADSDGENSFNGREDVANDIRLVFQNACLYNPPLHPVHEAAKHLLAYFEDHYASMLKKSGQAESAVGATSVPFLSGVPEFTSEAHANAHSNKIGDNAMSFSTRRVLPRSQPCKQLLLPPIKHTCHSCQGHTCNICHEGCLSMEPSLLICAGSACVGTKIRRGIHYYCTKDGTKTWCQKCYSSLPAVLPNDDGDLPLSGADQLFKRDLLKRRNDEDVVERWITCTKCKSFSHEICAFVNEFCTDRENYVCPLCSKSALPLDLHKRTRNDTNKESTSTLCVHSFVTGKEKPELVPDVISGTAFDARSLVSCEISSFIEAKVQKRMVELNCPKDAEKTLTVRVISDYEKDFNVPEVVLKHFRSQRTLDESVADKSLPGVTGVQYFADPSPRVSYRSKAISLFQRIDGMDVCIFTMYVQEYHGENQPSSTQRKRVYIAYIDSVEHFQPRLLRTNVYHEILVAYFATARARGFEYAHIWSCPPTRGNSFVFWGHPATQRTPSKELLLKWYHNALSLAVNRGVITDVQSLYQHSFQAFDKKKSKAKEDSCSQSVIVAPPLLDGDFWIEEAARAHSASVSRGVRSKKVVASIDEIPFFPHEVYKDHSKCPVMQVATIIKEYIMRHPLSTPFHQPVNAAALKLRDYHDIIKKPMDLGTVLTQCLLGDYNEFEEVCSDLDLIFKNAMRYNPKKHIIHNMASELWEYVAGRLSDLAKYWQNIGVRTPLSLKDGENITYSSFADIRMKLSSIITAPEGVIPSSTPSQDKCLIIPACTIDESSTQDQPASTSESNLLFQGAEGITKLMVGEDVWLLDKRHAQKEALKKKKKGGKKKNSSDQSNVDNEKRRESWLGDEVIAAVRRLRSDIFVCRLSPKPQIQMSNIEREKEKEFFAYVKDFEVSCTSLPTSQGIMSKPCTIPGVADTRHGLLEFSQYCNLQYDTVRRAKYSTAMLLYYLQNPDAPGIIPKCSHCSGDIAEVRWRRINKAFDERRRGTLNLSIRTTSIDMSREEVCGCCYDKMSPGRKDNFIPIRVSFLRNTN